MDIDNINFDQNWEWDEIVRWDYDKYDDNDCEGQDDTERDWDWTSEFRPPDSSDCEFSFNTYMR